MGHTSVMACVADWAPRGRSGLTLAGVPPALERITYLVRSPVVSKHTQEEGGQRQVKSPTAGLVEAQKEALEQLFQR